SAPRRDLHPFPTRRSSDLLAFDADGDGDLDIVFSNLTSNGRDYEKDPQMRILINDGQGNFQDETDARIPENSFSSYASTFIDFRSEEHTSELQSRENLVCR